MDNVAILSTPHSPLGTSLAAWLDAPLLTDHTLASADLYVSAGYPHVIPADWFPGRRIVNLHTGYLPWNRGMYPNVWPLVDGSPAGVTLHWMVPTLDAGPIIAQARVPVVPWDTAGTLQDRLVDAALHLFQAHWGDVLAGVPGFPQPAGGSLHRKNELALLDLPMERVTTVQDVLTTLQVRTCGEHGCPIRLGGQQVTARITLTPSS